jgi:nucleoside-diphosphate-sugar epimerase
MRVLVIGGTNFIGPHVVAELHRQEHEVTVYHRGVHEPDLPSDVRHIHSSRAAIPILHFPSSLSDPAPDVVLHMFPVGEDDTRAAIARFAGVVQRIVGISSGDVYRAYGRLIGTEPGPPEPIPLSEEAPLRESRFPYRPAATGPADWSYHYEKILAERALLTGPIPATVLRLPAVYGPGDPYRRLRPYIKRMLDGRPGILMGAAQARWRWSHGYVEDIGRAVASAIVDRRAAGRVYNLGEPSVPTMAERVARLGALMGWHGTIVFQSNAQLPAHLRAPFEPKQDLVMDTRRLRAELGFSESLASDEGLQRTIGWEQANPPESGDPDEEMYAVEDAAMVAAQRGAT